MAASYALLLDPIVEGDDDDFGWYYDSDAGGMNMPFGKYRGETMHKLELSYLVFCRNLNFAHGTPFAAAFDKYHGGLWEHVQESEKAYYYLNFRVPFGKRYLGMRFGDCHDKPYFVFCRKLRRLTEKHPLFFYALQMRLNNPRKYEVWREIGERLDPTKYDDVANLNASSDEDEPTQSDVDFIDDEDLEESEEQEDERIDEPQTPLKKKKKTNTATDNSSPKKSKRKRTLKTVPLERQTPITRSRNKDRPTTKKRKRTASHTTDEESDGANTYVDSDSSDAGPSTERPQTRSLTRQKSAAKGLAMEILEERGRIQKKHRSDDETPCYVCSSADLDNVPISTLILGLCDACRPIMGMKAQGSSPTPANSETTAPSDYHTTSKSRAPSSSSRSLRKHAIVKSTGSVRRNTRQVKTQREMSDPDDSEWQPE